MAKFKGVVLSCKICGKEFKVPQCRAKTAEFCGHECSVIGRAQKMSKPKIAVICKGCGVTFYDHPCHAGRRIYCSKACKDSNEDYQQKMRAKVLGDKNPMWGGGIIPHSDGYLYQHAPEHPFASNGYVLQHRLVAEEHLRKTNPDSIALVKIEGKRYLRKEFAVHHKDMDRVNNTPENLMVLTNSEHQKLHNAIRRAAKEINNVFK